jgi:hypothetical protein
MIARIWPWSVSPRSSTWPRLHNRSTFRVGGNWGDYPESPLREAYGCRGSPMKLPMKSTTDPKRPGGTLPADTLPRDTCKQSVPLNNRSLTLRVLH